MMTIRLPLKLSTKLVSELNEAGSREIGGILMGEQLSPGDFKIVEITVQKHGGYFARFIREAQEAFRALSSFFSSKSFEYKRFNYLGEWHSHPSFSIKPSARDDSSMIEIVSDTKTKANFVVLLIVRLKSESDLEGTVTVYMPDKSVHQGVLEFCHD